MTIDHIETAIIGAGQAGLATRYHLQQRGRPCLIRTASRVGDNWRGHWDSLRLYSPAGYDGLPGFPFPGSAGGPIPTKDQVADYLAAYAERFQLPVRPCSHVERLQTSNGRYLRSSSVSIISLPTMSSSRPDLRPDTDIPDFAPNSTLRFDSCTRASTAGRHSSNRARSSSSARPTPAPTSPSRSAARTRRSSPVGIRGADPVRLDHRCARFLLPVFLFLASTWSPGVRRSAARPWTRSASMAAPCCG